MSVEKRKNFIISVAYFFMIAGGFYLFMKYAFGVLFPFMLAFFIAMISQKPINRLVERTPLKKGPLAVIFVLLVVAVSGLIVFLAGSRVVAELKSLSESVIAWITGLPELFWNNEERIRGFVSALPEYIRPFFNGFIDGISESLESFAGESAQSGFSGSFGVSWLIAPVQSLWSTAKTLPGALITVIISIVSCALMITEYDGMVDFIRRRIPPEKRPMASSIKRLATSAMWKYLKANIILMIIAFFQAFLGLNILRVFKIYTGGNIIAISVLAAIADFLPILGIGSVLLPWAGFALVMGNYKLGVCVIILYILCAGMRQAVEPKVYSASLGIPPIVSLLSLYLGLQLFGLPGLIIVPIIVTVIKTLSDEGIFKAGAVPSPEAGCN